jgi:hypothetical protein
MQRPTRGGKGGRARRTRGGKGERASAAKANARRREDVRAQGKDGAIAVFIGAL